MSSSQESEKTINFNVEKHKYLLAGISVLLIAIIGFITLYDFRYLWATKMWAFVFTLFYVFFLILSASILTRIINYFCDEYSNKNRDSCKYCGAASAGPFLCSNCNSITWYNLKNSDWILPTSIFILEHRWAVVTAITGALYIGPIYSLIEKGKEISRKEISTQIENEESLSHMLNELSTARSIIVNLEMTNGIKGYNMEEWSKLNTSYTSIYWNIVPAFEQLLESTCRRNKRFRKAIKKTRYDEKISFNEFKKMIEKEKDLLIYGPAYVINHQDFELNCVTRFMEYMNSVYKYERFPSIENINNRKESARRLFHELRISSIMMRCLIDSKWLLNEGRYPSEAADPAFYFKSMFVGGEKEELDSSIYNLNFSYNVRTIDAFTPIDTLEKSSVPTN